VSKKSNHFRCVYN